MKNKLLKFIPILSIIFTLFLTTFVSAAVPPIPTPTTATAKKHVVKMYISWNTGTELDEAYYVGWDDDTVRLSYNTFTKKFEFVDRVTSATKVITFEKIFMWIGDGKTFVGDEFTKYSSNWNTAPIVQTTSEVTATNNYFIVSSDEDLVDQNGNSIFMNPPPTSQPPNDFIAVMQGVNAPAMRLKPDTNSNITTQQHVIAYSSMPMVDKLENYSYKVYLNGTQITDYKTRVNLRGYYSDYWFKFEFLPKWVEGANIIKVELYKSGGLVLSQTATYSATFSTVPQYPWDDGTDDGYTPPDGGANTNDAPDRSNYSDGIIGSIEYGFDTLIYYITYPFKAIAEGLLELVNMITSSFTWIGEFTSFAQQFLNIFPAPIQALLYSALMGGVVIGIIKLVRK